MVCCRSILGTALVPLVACQDNSESATMLQVNKASSFHTTPHRAILAATHAKSQTDASLIVENLARAAVKGEVTIDEGTKEALEILLKALDDPNTGAYAAINSASAGDYKLRELAAEAVEQCSETFASQRAFGEVEAKQVAEFEQSHADCRDRLKVLTTEEEQICNAMTNFLNEIQNDHCQTRRTRDQMTQWFESIKDGEKYWIEKRDACVAAELARSNKDKECDGIQGDYEGEYCSHRRSVHTACATYFGCYDTEVKNFEQILESTEVTQESRKIEFTALEKIKCFIDVLMSDDDNEKRQGQLEECQSKSIDTTHLNLGIPAINGKESCDVTDVAVYPGTPTFPQRYEGMLDVNSCQSCPAFPESLQVEGRTCIEVDDTPQGWTNGRHAEKDGITYMGGYDVSVQTVSKLFSLSPNTKYKWSMVLDTWASVDNEAIVIKAGSESFNIASRSHNQCNNGWQTHPYGLGQVVGSTGSGHHGWQDCYMEVENVITTGDDGNIRVEMHMAINQAAHDEAWGWHNMKFVPLSCSRDSLEKILDDCSGWSNQKTAQKDGICYMGAFDNTAQRVTKTFRGLTPGCSYTWKAEIDTYASVDNEQMTFTVNKQPFSFASRSHNSCNNGWIEYPNDFGDFLGSDGSAHSSWKDCHKTFQAEFIAPASGTAEIEMYMAIDQAISDEGWGWHSMEFERGTCRSLNRASEGSAAPDTTKANVIATKSEMLEAGWSWTGCATNDHGGDSLTNGIWCHSQQEMHLKVPSLGGSGKCTATWSNDYTNTAANGFVRLMKNGEQLGEARAKETKTVTFDYQTGDNLEFWEGFAIAKTPANWLQCEASGASAAPPPPTCPSGVGQTATVDNRCYFVHSEHSMTIDTGRDWCESHGGELASIHTSEANNAVLQLLTKSNGDRVSAWIGALRTNSANKDQQGTWTWEDGSEWSQISWATDGLNHNSGTLHETRICIHSDQKWHDWTHGTTPKGVVCQVQA